MSRPVVVEPPAQQDIARAFAAYEAVTPGRGDQFLAAVRDALGRIEQFPESYAAGRRGVRQAPVDNFAYIVEYVASDVSVNVIAVTHARRNRPQP